MRALKVWGGRKFVDGKQVRVIIATTSMKRVAELVDLPYTRVRDYFSITGNEQELHVALSAPEVVWVINDEFRSSDTYHQLVK